MHAKAMLLVDDDEAEIAKRDAFLKQGVRADRDVDRALARAPRASAPRSAALSRPVRSAMRSPAASASGRIRSKCWRARISVGAISAACRPASTTPAMASSATIVLPEPTSPCSSRSMRFGAARSARISASACVWRRGERKGQRGFDPGGEAPVAGAERPARLRMRARTISSAS